MLEGIQRLGEQRLLLLSHATEIKINSLEKTIELTQNVLCATKTNLPISLLCLQLSEVQSGTQCSGYE